MVNQSESSDMRDKEIFDDFTGRLSADEEKSTALAAIETLHSIVQQSSATTVNGLTEELHRAVTIMCATDYSTTSVKSASELFMRFISLAALDHTDFEELKRIFFERGEQFIRRLAASKAKIVKHALPFIRDGQRILTTSYSRLVCQSLIDAAKEGNKKFRVFVTESQPDRFGLKTKARLDSEGIPCTVILDSAVGYIMGSIDLVLVGAEGVMETGGIINQIGTLGIAISAKAMNKPMHVMTESVKFVKEYPLNQNDVPLAFKYRASIRESGKDLEEEHPAVDYTPPQYIKLLFTDLGILTPAAVSDELIKLYL